MARLLFFGRLRDAVGAGELAVSVPAGIGDVQSLRDWLSRDHPALADANVKVAVNGALAPGNPALTPDDEIAFMPPMSGG